MESETTFKMFRLLNVTKGVCLRCFKVQVAIRYGILYYRLLHLIIQYLIVLLIVIVAIVIPFSTWHASRSKPSSWKAAPSSSTCSTEA